ncbi:MAG: hypothetical protein IJR63_05175 [Synergistaceae bacterium]|nr:hypothetical protein [Synergistaceae bacterium]
MSNDSRSGCAMNEPRIGRVQLIRRVRDKFDISKGAVREKVCNNDIDRIFSGMGG